jgi:hypothetical protein
MGSAELKRHLPLELHPIRSAKVKGSQIRLLDMLVLRTGQAPSTSH